MRATDSVHTHRLQLRELTMQGILVEGSPQTTEVMMLAHAVELEVFTVEPKACLRVEAEITKARRGLIDIYHLSSHFHLRTHLVCIRGIARPEQGAGNCYGRPQTPRPTDNTSVGIQQRVLNCPRTITGCGIPPNEAERVFERFVKLNTFKEGIGLGLSLCRTLAERLSGSIRLDTTYTQGARFVVTIPIPVVQD